VLKKTVEKMAELATAHPAKRVVTCFQ